MMVPDMMTMKSAGTNDQQPSSNKANSTRQTTPLQWASEASTTKRHENRRRLQNTNIYKPQMWYFETWTRTSSKTAIKKAMLEKRERERKTDSKNNHHEHHQHQRSSKAGQNICERNKTARWGWTLSMAPCHHNKFASPSSLDWFPGPSLQNCALQPQHVCQFSLPWTCWQHQK